MTLNAIEFVAQLIMAASCSYSGPCSLYFPHTVTTTRISLVGDSHNCSKPVIFQSQSQEKCEGRGAYPLLRLPQDFDYFN